MLNEWWHSDLIRYRCVRGWCTDYIMNWNIGKTRVMTFATKSNALKTPQFFYCMRWRHQPARCSNRLKTTFFVSTFGLYFLSITYVFRPHRKHRKLYAFAVSHLNETQFSINFIPWHSITSSDVKNLERVQWIFVSSCYSSISPTNIWVMTTHFTV